MRITEQLLAIAGTCESEHANALTPLIDAIKQHVGDALVGVVFYGSCLRSGVLANGLVDFYVVVNAYHRAHGYGVSAIANHLIPPNVYYIEAPSGDTRLRAKYAVVSEADLAHGTKDAWLSSLWGRLAQPCAVVQASDAAARIRLRVYLGQAVVTLLDESLPALTSPAMPAEVFSQALALSYSGELRTEKSGRAEEITSSASQEYARRVHAARALLGYASDVDACGRLSWQANEAARTRATRRWALRRPIGRAWSVARLAKACFTFGNAVDYGTWKLARHTGVEIQISERVRRHPLIFGWPVLWRLYRQGLLR